MAVQRTENVDYIGIVGEEGYTEREARFLVFAAEHSGYFTPAHFRRFLALKAGKTSQNLIDRAVRKRHAIEVHTKAGATAVLRMSERFCEALDLPAPRRTEAKIRLQALDYALENSTLDYLVREREKVKYFSSLGVPNRAMSKQNGHYFDERFPMFRLRNGAGFVYIDHGSLDSWESFIDRYSPLFGSLRKTVVYFATAIRDVRRGLCAFEAKVERMSKNRAELKRLEGILIRDLGGPELQQLKRLREAMWGVDSWVNVQVEGFRLSNRYGFLDESVSQ